MFFILLLIIVSLIALKVVKLSQFWVPFAITYESFPAYLFRVIWRYNTRVVAEVLREDVKRYGPIYGSYRGFKPALIVSDMEIAKDVLIKQFNNFFNRSTEFCSGDPLWDNILMNMPYEQWKSLRTVMSYTFTGSKMRGMIPKFDNVSKRLLNKFEKIARSPNNTKMVLKDDLKAYGIDSMTVVSFGLDPNAIEDTESQFRKNAAELLKPGLSMMLFYLLLVPNIMKYLPGIDFPPAHVSKFFGTVAKHSLAEKREKLDEVIASGTADIMDLQLIAQRDDPKLITDEMLASSAFLFLIAALDGITITVEFTCYYLAIHPEIQEKAYDEVLAVLQGRTEVEYEDVLQIKYVEACLLEALRCAPIVPLFDRICTIDTRVNGIQIKKVECFILDYMVISRREFRDSNLTFSCDSLM